MFNSLKSKITIPIIGILVLMITAIVVYVSISSANLVENFTDERMNSAAKSVRAYIDSYELRTLVAASAVGSSGELARHVNDGDRDAILQYLLEKTEIFDIDYFIVTDHEGTTLVRSHVPDLYGDNIIHIAPIGAGLQGLNQTIYTVTPTVPMVMSTSAPILDGDRIIGSVASNINFGINEFVDRLHNVFDVDATVFAGDTSVSSTLIHPETGERAVGTAVAPHIAEAVLGRGEPVTLELNIFGTLPYIAHYFPLHGADGNPSGMIFLGVSQEHSYATIATVRLTMIIIGIVSAVMAAAAVLYLITASLKPLEGITRSVKKVADGNLNVNLSKADISKDEIGTLTLDIISLVDTISNLTKDLEYTTSRQMQGFFSHRLDCSKYKGSFANVAKNSNNLLDSIAAEDKALLALLSSFAHGDFNVNVPDFPNERHVYTENMSLLQNNLERIVNDIDKLAKGAAGGNFDQKIDNSQFEGSWKDVSDTLNYLMESIEVPLSEIEHNVVLMSNGDFSMVKGDFQGHFKVVKDACNLNNSSTFSLINEISEVLTAIADGDLTVSTKQNYKGSYAPIKVAMNHIVESLNNTMTDVRSTIDQVASGAEQISTSAFQLAEGATRQTASIEELSSSITTIHEQATLASSDATLADENTRRSQERTVQGRGAVGSMTDIMDKIKSSSEGIAKIIDVITNIAFQTNLLALNASVEAARAGEHGKGFSVVADEVRTLAGRSQQSASDTTEIIDSDTKLVEEGMKAAEEVVASFETIASEIDEISRLISHIADISGEQLESISNINASVSEITGVIANTSATAEESASASQELSFQAEELRKKIAFFKLKTV
ncbi:MAG: methyl-accepting chemotaxis protein [Defluviitaleaceae bacterium]|nr:methyl-accepting chemotaxis protein [Defluviitaleaceae bacterium]